MRGKTDWKNSIVSFDERRDLILAGSKEETIHFCINQFYQIALNAISQRDAFYAALSGGTTPNAIFKGLTQSPFKDQLDWSKVFLFWTDERSVPATDSESNYYQAMNAGLQLLPIQPDHIFRMEAEGDIEEGALKYEKLIREKVPEAKFDLMMLGMGDDGHTASLFPETHALHTSNRLVVANYVPQKKTWRMTLTYDCISNARVICIYVLGSQKADTVNLVLTGPYNPDHYPVQKVGTPSNKSIWILDNSAASKLVENNT